MVAGAVTYGMLGMIVGSTGDEVGIATGGIVGTGTGGFIGSQASDSNVAQAAIIVPGVVILGSVALGGLLVLAIAATGGITIGN